MLDVLRMAAVLGDPWEPSELAEVTDRSVDEVVDVLDRAADSGLVIVDAGWGRFAHPLVRSELLRPLGARARRALHRQVAERLAESAVSVTGPAGDELAVRIAGHLTRAQPDVDPAEVAERAWEAGRIALRGDSWHAASQLFAAAAAALDAAGGPPVESARRHLAAAKAAYLDLDPERCEQAAAAAIDAARRAPDDPRGRRAVAPGGAGGGAQPLRPGRDAGEPGGGRRAGAGAGRCRRPDRRLAAGRGPGVPGRGAAPVGRERPGLRPARHRREELAGASHAARVAAGVDGDPLFDDPRFRVELVEGLHRMAGLELAAAEECFRRAEAVGSKWSALTAQSRHALVRLVRGSVTSATRELEEVEQRAVGRRFWGEASLAAAQHAFAAVLAGSPDAEEVVARALRLYRRAGSDPAAVVLAPASAALAARRGGDDVLRATGRLAPPFSRSSLCAVLSAVEAGDVEAVRATLVSASWRHGLVGPVTMQNQAIPVALVEAGDVLGDADLVARGEAPLRALYERGAAVTLGWPALVPRLLAVCCRMAGRPGDAGAYLDHAASLADRHDLAVEIALIRLERARYVAAIGRSAGEVRPLVVDALRRFDTLGLHGWVARAEVVAHDLSLGAFTGVDATPRERTILTTDIVGSTQANARLGDALYVEQLRVHDRLVRTRVRERNGVEIKHTGDGINAVFDDPADAVRAALALQTDLERWYQAEPDLALRVRCGLARGRVIPSGGDFFGLVQSEAARLCALADAGDVFGSARVVEALQGDAARDLAARSLGIHHLRGLPDVTAVYRLVAG